MREMIQQILDAALARGVSFADLRVAEGEATSVSVEAEARIMPSEVPLEERVQAIFENSLSHQVIANTFGTYIEQGGVRCSVRVAATAQDGDVRQFATKSQARPCGYELMADMDPEDFAGVAADKALALLDAEPAPAGVFDVIIDPRVCGLLVHEAFGHNAEADAVWAGESILAGKEGQPVASELVSIVDDPTRKGLNGSFTYDHEGVPAVRHEIVRDGVLLGYLHSLETAARMAAKPNGAARAMNHQYEPIVRMSNTFIEPGDATLEEMIESTEHGLLLEGGYWGYVFTARGQFTCNVENAYAIENGEIGQHYRNASISGLTLETLQKVDAVGADLSFDLGGMCGKGGQSMRVDAGGPHLRIREVVVGGQQHL